MPPRFVDLTGLAEILNVTPRQARALVVSGDVPAIRVGGRGEWRIETSQIEAYIQRMYAQTRAEIEARGGRGETEADAVHSEVEAGGVRGETEG